ncbi:hypothetical protein MSAN_01748800 [Mycena sanguinolenta]|uniref:Uncharacterized protein n=1 Tax=Mycena sanguinolenta TaxID=230812 RepID=A0A8H7CTS3_9AGAR|nr:hypothetical protein MSAN_01748800 [Mycena sanguinolenta]
MSFLPFHCRILDLPLPPTLPSSKQSSKYSYEWQRMTNLFVIHGAIFGALIFGVLVCRHRIRPGTFPGFTLTSGSIPRCSAAAGALWTINTSHLALHTYAALDYIVDAL